MPRRSPIPQRHRTPLGYSQSEWYASVLRDQDRRDQLYREQMERTIARELARTPPHQPAPS